MKKTLAKKFFYTVIFLFCLSFFFTILSSHDFAQSTSKKSIQKKDDQKLEFTIDVDYFLLDVLAFDKEGHHVLDLDKDDFELKVDGKTVPIASLDKYSYMDDSYLRKINTTDEAGGDNDLVEYKTDFVLDENGFQKEITPFIADSLSINSQPPRTFAIVFANLPMLPVRWKFLRDGLIDYITNYMGDNIQVAVFSMGMSDLGILLPFTKDKSAVLKTVKTYLDSRWISKEEEDYSDDVKRNFDLDEESDYFYMMADTPTPDLDHAASSWIISGFDNIIIQQNTVFSVFKQFDTIINKLSGIPGRKNLLFFSEGLPYVPDTLSEYVRTQERMRFLASRMNKYNVSLYTFDMFTSRNLSASGVRAGLLADLSSATNGAFFKWLGNSRKKISSSLVQTDVMTVNYYLVGFYLNGIHLSDDSKAELTVKRKDVTLVYNEWLKGKKTLGTDRYLKEMESSRKLFTEKTFTEIPESVEFQCLPGDQHKTWLIISSRFPSMDAVIEEPEDSSARKQKMEISDLKAELLLTLENKAEKEIHYALKKIEVPTEKLTENIIYNYRILLDPGLYALKSVLYSRNNGKSVTVEREITIPDFYFTNDVSSTVILDTINSSFTIQNQIQSDNKLKFELEKYPFYPAGTLLLPAHLPEYKVSETVPFFIYYNRNCSKKDSLSVELVSEDSGETTIIPDAVFESPSPFLEDFMIIRGEFKIPLLKAGKYTLRPAFGEDTESSYAELLIKEN